MKLFLSRKRFFSKISLTKNQGVIVLKYKGAKEMTTAKKTTEQVLKELRDRLDQVNRNASDRDERLSNDSIDLDDCFMSVWANNVVRNEILLKIEILENGGYPFNELFDLDGEVVSDRVIRGKFGHSWVVRPEKQAKFGKFIGHGLTEKTYTKKGLQVKEVLRKAWVNQAGNPFKIDKYYWE